jgi:GNAT superfamily N-acetyltransferase
MQPTTLRTMAPTDVEPIAIAFERQGWGDRRSMLNWVTRYRYARPLVAVADDTIVGTGIACINGPVGWIGTIWTHPDRRRRGIGMALTEAVVRAAEAAGCRTLVLTATEAGRPMYERIGFEVQSGYRILEAPGTGIGADDPRGRPFRAEDLGAMARLASQATGEDREHLLTSFASPETARCWDDRDGRLAGFAVAAPWGSVHAIAPILDDGLAILRDRRSRRPPDHRVRTGLLIENEAGLERLLSDGWTDAWQAPRLVRGDPLAWEPRSIWGQFSFAIG